MSLQDRIPENTGPRRADDDANLISRLFPDRVAVAAVRLSDEQFPLCPEEERYISRATAKRRIEFSAGRHCARLAMVQIGHPPSALPSGPDRAPIWPTGLVGSISHIDTLCAAAVAPRTRFRSIGIDMEPVGAVGTALASDIMRPDERLALDGSAASDGADWPSLYFCLKEAAYKAFHPLFRTVIGFHEMRILPLPRPERFRAEAGVPGAPVFEGSYAVRHGRIHAACWYPGPL